MALSCGVIFGSDWLPPIVPNATAYAVVRKQERVAVKEQRDADGGRCSHHDVIDTEYVLRLITDAVTTSRSGNQ